MNVKAINKIEDAQALLSTFAVLVNFYDEDGSGNFNHGAFLIVQSIDKTLIESKEILIDSDQ